ncbi:MAG: hypothetical protein V4702_03130 [Patescibacteria group bacterium]
MKLRTNQSGFSAVELIIILAVVAGLGFVGYTVYDRQPDKKTTDNTSQQPKNESATATDVGSAPEIKSTSDLDKASATLDQTDPDGSNSTDASQLDSEVSTF